jgi:hypothetical protein
MDLIMKNKILVAYENESSLTIRLTPETIGEFLTRMSPSQIDKCFQIYREASYFVHQDEWKEKKANIISQLNKIKFDKEGNPYTE